MGDMWATVIFKVFSAFDTIADQFRPVPGYPMQSRFRNQAPQALGRGRLACSSTTTLAPDRASRIAAAPPAGPVPTIATSTFIYAARHPPCTRHPHHTEERELNTTPRCTILEKPRKFNALFMKQSRLP